MGRIIGLDFGTKRTGIAATDPMKIIVSPLTTLPTSEVLGFLKEYSKTESVESIVCGDPGSENPDTLKALKQFIDSIKSGFPDIPIMFQDEHLTSKRASQIIARSGLRKSKRRDKSLIDKVSAVLILQEYLGHLDDVHTI